MRKLIVLIVVLALGFYVAWPAWSSYQILDGLKRSDAQLLDRKIDFPGIRETLRPGVAAEVDRSLAKAGGGALKQLAPNLVDAALKSLVTPQNIGELFAGGSRASGLIKDFIAKQAGGVGGLLTSGGSGLTVPGGSQVPGLEALGKAFGRGDKPANPAAPASPMTADKAPSFGFSTIKHIAFQGPMAFEIGLAKDPNAAAADATAQMSFRDFDWILTGLTLRPR